MANPFLVKFSLPGGVCRCATMHTCICSSAYVICTIYSIPFFPYFVTFNSAKRDNFGPQCPEKYGPHLFHFLKNDYLDDTALILLKEYEIRIFHFLDTLILYSLLDTLIIYFFIVFQTS